MNMASREGEEGECGKGTFGDGLQGQTSRPFKRAKTKLKTVQVMRDERRETRDER